MILGSTDLVRSIVQNFTIVATFLLLYNFIPERIISRSKLAYSVCAGIIFGIAAILSMPLLWENTNPTALGFNVILVPLSGFLGGPISSLIVSASLMAGSMASRGTLLVSDLVTVLCGILAGALFLRARGSSRFPKSFVVQYSLLGIGVAVVEFLGFFIALLMRGPQFQPFSMFLLIDLAPFFLLSIVGTIVLGGIITVIDRRKQAELELVEYKTHLEELVKEKTAELRKENALRKATFDATADGIVVVDREGNFRAYNQKAMHMLGLPPCLHGKPEAPCVFADIAISLLADPETFFCTIAALPESAEQVVTSDLRFRDGRVFELYVQPEMIGDRVMGRVYSIRDITEQRLAEEAIRASNNKLVLLSDITRHDILNQMTIVSGYLHLFQDTVHDPSDMKRIEIMKNSLEVMRLQIEFTRDYQDLGIAKPVWQNVQGSFSKATVPFAGKASFRCDTSNLEIYADPLIERVFFNLVDNSLRHGGRVSEIRLFTQNAGPDQLLVYEDDGVGVPDNEKEKIFDKGFGKHTGLGMFLIREILSITGIGIRETGTCGQGVRFEIRIPPGKFRSGP